MPTRGRDTTGKVNVRRSQSTQPLTQRGKGFRSLVEVVHSSHTGLHVFRGDLRHRLRLTTRSPMSMKIVEARCQGLPVCVNHLRTRRHLYVLANSDDSISLDQHCFDLGQCTCTIEDHRADNRRCIRCRCGYGRRRGSERANCGKRNENTFGHELRLRFADPIMRLRNRIPEQARVIA